MLQYNTIKAKYPGALLLFRVGDFYETFGQDAVKASGILGIVLTKRGNGSGTQVGAVDVSGNASFIGTLAITGAITQNGNQVLHAGNVATYALPIGGGTLTGTVTATNFIGPGTSLTGTASSLVAGTARQSS